VNSSVLVSRCFHKTASQRRAQVRWAASGPALVLAAEPGQAGDLGPCLVIDPGLSTADVLGHVRAVEREIALPSELVDRVTTSTANLAHSRAGRVVRSSC
jgi:hypothetical protein